MPNSTCCSFQSPILINVVPYILILEVILGITGNFGTLVMFAMDIKNLKPNSIYLAQMAVANFVLLFFLPYRAHYYINDMDWVFGDAFCRAMLFFVAGNRAASIFFLTTVAVDRYLKIVHPQHRLNRVSLTYAMWVSVFLWALVLASTVHLLTSPKFFNVNNHTQCESFNICLDNNPASTWHSTFYLLQFCVPGSIIFFCTACIVWELKTKTMDNTGKVKRAVMFVCIVAVVFFFCYFPSTAARASVWILKKWYNECSYFSGVNDAFYVSLVLTYLNCVLNPVIFYFSTPANSVDIQKLIRLLTGQKEETVPGKSSVATLTSN